MITKYVEVLTYDDEITIYKREWCEKIEHVVLVGKQKDTRFKKYLLHTTDNSINISGLTDQYYTIKVYPRSLFKRLIKPRLTVTTKPTKTSPEILIIGSGRCGTQSISSYLNGMHFTNRKTVSARHETLCEYVLPAIVKKDKEQIIRFYNGFSHDIESSPYYTSWAGVLPASKIIHIIRDGRRVVQSGMNRGWYNRESLWNKMKPRFKGSNFEKCCHFWVYQVNTADQYADKTIRLEDISRSESDQKQLLDYLQIEHTDKKFPVMNTGKVMSSNHTWSDCQREAFIEICGVTMDKYYPGWRVS